MKPSRIPVRSINDFQGNIIFAIPSSFHFFTVYVPNNPREITAAALLNPRATGSIRSARRGVINDEAALERVPLHFPSLERLTNFQRSFIFWFFPSKRPRSVDWSGADHWIISSIEFPTVLDLFRLFIIIEYHYWPIPLIPVKRQICYTIINRYDFLSPMITTFPLRFDQIEMVRPL